MAARPKTLLKLADVPLLTFVSSGTGTLRFSVGDRVMENFLSTIFDVIELAPGFGEVAELFGVIA